MARDVLDTRALNRALLARQLLLRRARLSPSRALERTGGLQTQYSPSGYIGLWSRLDGFRRTHLTRALEQGRVVQGTLMRVTIHMVSARDYPLFAAAVRRSRREWFARVAKDRALEPEQWRRVASQIRKALAHGPLRGAELVAYLEDQGYSKGIWEGAGLWVDLVRVPPSGTWERRRADIYGLAEQYVAMAEVGEDDALEHLVRRYLGGFGPAGIGDIAAWTGVPANSLRPVVERLELRHFRDSDGGDLLDLPRRPLPASDTVAPVRFLPTWDATLLVHARRTQILPEEYRSLVFNTKNPQSVGTFLVDGAVAGAWRHEAGKVRLEPFAPLPRPVRRELGQESDRLAAFLA
ncbi:MAG TPA: winged helix DNA-binding domain-containing protein [Acidimicrobiia bacterium]